MTAARPSALPAGSEPYRTVGPFDESTLPDGLRGEHRLKQGAWGLLRLAEGTVRFVWDDAEGGAEELVAPAEFVVPPLVPHHLEGDGPFSLTIVFHR